MLGVFFARAPAPDLSEALQAILLVRFRSNVPRREASVSEEERRLLAFRFVKLLCSHERRKKPSQLYLGCAQRFTMCLSYNSKGNALRSERLLYDNPSRYRSLKAHLRCSPFRRRDA